MFLPKWYQKSKFTRIDGGSETTMLQIIGKRIDPSGLSNSSFSQYQNIYVLFSLPFRGTTLSK